jgi:phage terminase large subunit-like protein
VYPNKKELKPQNKIDLYMAELFAYKMLTDNLDSMKSIIGWYPPEDA